MWAVIRRRQSFTIGLAARKREYRTAFKIDLGKIRGRGDGEDGGELSIARKRAADTAIADGDSGFVLGPVSGKRKTATDCEELIGQIDGERIVAMEQNRAYLPPYCRFGAYLLFERGSKVVFLVPDPGQKRVY